MECRYRFRIRSTRQTEQERSALLQQNASRYAPYRRDNQQQLQPRVYPQADKAQYASESGRNSRPSAIQDGIRGRCHPQEKPLDPHPRPGEFPCAEERAERQKDLQVLPLVSRARRLRCPA